MKDTEKVSYLGVRHIQITLLFGLLMVGYGMRVNLSVGIVAMTNEDINPDFPTYNWSVSTKSVLQSSFFWGYIIPQVGAGQLAEHYGPKWFLIAAMTLSSLFTLLIPIVANYGAHFVIVCRVMQGLTQGFFFPSIQYLLSKWVPLNERSRMGSFVYAGGPLGSVLSLPVTGWISASTWGWPSAFYLYALMGVIWVGLWYWLGSNDPAQHGTISEKERKYILQSSGASNGQDEIATPWKEIVTSLPVWAIVIAYMGQHWGYWTLMTEIPTYMNAILNYDIEENGLLSAAPYLTLWILSFFFSYMSDLLINRKILSTGNARKLASAIGLVGPAIALFVLGALRDPGRAEAIGLLILAVGINSAIFSGHQVNHIDISPRFAATLMGITNGIGNICSLLAPLTVQYVVTDEANPDEWQTVFFIAASIYLGCDIFYTIFGKGEKQKWDTSHADLKRQISRESVIIT